MKVVNYMRHEDRITPPSSEGDACCTRPASAHSRFEDGVTSGTVVVAAAAVRLLPTKKQKRETLAFLGCFVGVDGDDVVVVAAASPIAAAHADRASAVELLPLES